MAWSWLSFGAGIWLGLTIGGVAVLRIWWELEKEADKAFFQGFEQAAKVIEDWRPIDDGPGQ